MALNSKHANVLLNIQVLTSSELFQVNISRERGVDDKHICETLGNTLHEQIIINMKITMTSHSQSLSGLNFFVS